MSQRMKVFLVGVAASLALSAPARVQACGGFFCNSVPVDQTGEQIVFSLDEKGVTATIRIQYSGSAKDFAWVVPVMSKPVLRIGAPSLFNVLRNNTQPQWMLELGTLASCFGRGGQDFRGSAGTNPGAPPPAAQPGVNVVDMQEVGPYESVTLEATDSAELIGWLNKNGYDQPASSTPLIEHYVKAGMLFVALKLKQNASVGEIQPISLEMTHQEACVPLILTQVAAAPNMPVQIFVLAKTQAAPRNWFAVEVNQKRIDWLNGGVNYQTLLNQAVDEAAGHGFVTEFAGKTPALKGALYVPERYDLAGIRNAKDPVELMAAITRSNLPLDATMLSLLRKYIPKPASLATVPDQQFYANLALYRSSLGNLTVDGAAFAVELDERVISPLRRGQEMLDSQPYLTRLYSTVSPSEMNRDPFFHFNGELPNVSNIHRARAVAGSCTTSGIANLMVQLDNGQRVTLTNALGMPLANSSSTTDQPAASRIALVGTGGPASVYSKAQARVVDDALNRDPAEIVRTMHPGTPSNASSGACNLSGMSHYSLGSIFTLGLLAAMVLAYRRARRK
jgi:hypothetical protein